MVARTPAPVVWQSLYLQMAWYVYVLCHLHAEPESAPGLLFTYKRTDILSPNFVKPRSREIGCHSDRIALNFDGHLSSAATRAIVKVYTRIWRFRDFTRSCRKTSVRLVNRGPGWLRPLLNLRRRPFMFNTQYFLRILVHRLVIYVACVRTSVRVFVYACVCVYPKYILYIYTHIKQYSDTDCFRMGFHHTDLDHWLIISFPVSCMRLYQTEIWHTQSDHYVRLDISMA